VQLRKGKMNFTTPDLPAISNIVVAAATKGVVAKL
jgi:hypothetical protein